MIGFKQKKNQFFLAISVALIPDCIKNGIGILDREEHSSQALATLYFLSRNLESLFRIQLIVTAQCWPKCRYKLFFS
jgi:hypothetical protein